jgi:hypothetical protein
MRAKLLDDDNPRRRIDPGFVPDTGIRLGIVVVFPALTLYLVKLLD